MASIPTVEQLMSENIFSLLAMESLSVDEQAEFIARFADTLQLRVLGSVLQRLDRAQQEELDGLPAERMLAFIEEQGIDVQALIMQEALNYRIELLSAYNLMTTPLPTA